jgi:hypothetical protein
MSDGDSQTTVGSYGINSGPQLSVEYRYLRPYDFVTMTVTLTIPPGYPVSGANPVRYYHVIDTYLGGSDNGCGVSYLDTNGHRMVGTYPPASGTTCPSTSVPAGVSVVESFRERTGMGFSNYCTDDWSDFWQSSTAGYPCAISNSNSLPNTVTSTYRDTGMAIEYQFTAVGTYTFAYDFVIGSTAVPAYDHLELQYTAGSNLCPMDVKVLGCTSNKVPCPAGSELNASFSGTLTASGSGATWTPSANFAIAAGTPQATLTAQPLAPGGIITLDASGLSATPLNGVKCWNGTAATCTMVLPNAGCFASDLDACSNLTGVPARCGATGNRLYTKIAGQALSFDLVALKGSPKTVDTAFNSGAGNPVTVDLISSSATAVGPIAARPAHRLLSAASRRRPLRSPPGARRRRPVIRCRRARIPMPTRTSGCVSTRATVRFARMTALPSVRLLSVLSRRSMQTQTRRGSALLSVLWSRLALLSRLPPIRARRVMTVRQVWRRR